MSNNNSRTLASPYTINNTGTSVPYTLDSIQNYNGSYIMTVTNASDTAYFNASNVLNTVK